MKALLIVAHGSRRKESNDEVHRLSEQIGKNTDVALDWVAPAFLEISSPKANSAIADLVNNGATEIMVLPYFLAAGTHVVSDIPKLIEAEQEKHPSVHFKILPHLGALPGIGTLILNQVSPLPEVHAKKTE